MEILALVLRIVPVTAIVMGLIMVGVAGFGLIEVVALFKKSGDSGNYCAKPQTVGDVVDTNSSSHTQKEKEYEADSNHRSCNYVRINVIADVLAMIAGIVQIAFGGIFLFVPSLRKIVVMGYCAIFLMCLVSLICFALTLGFFSQEANEYALEDTLTKDDDFQDGYFKERRKIYKRLHQARKLGAPAVGINLVFVTLFLLINCNSIIPDAGRSYNQVDGDQSAHNIAAEHSGPNLAADHSAHSSQPDQTQQ